jgi:hypothetical protein
VTFLLMTWTNSPAQLSSAMRNCPAARCHALSLPLWTVTVGADIVRAHQLPRLRCRLLARVTSSGQRHGSAA